MSFSSADYPLFLVAVFAVYALTRVGGTSGRVARMGVLVLLGDLVYLLLAKDVSALWDPLGGLAFGAIAEETARAPVWRLAIGAAVLGGALWAGWRWGGRLERRAAQRALELLAGERRLVVAHRITPGAGDAGRAAARPGRRARRRAARRRRPCCSIRRRRGPPASTGRCRRR